MSNFNSVSGEDVVTATTTVENHMNKYRLRWVKTYDEIDAVRENIQYERIYWPKSQIYEYEYDEMDSYFEICKYTIV